MNAGWVRVRCRQVCLGLILSPGRVRWPQICGVLSHPHRHGFKAMRRVVSHSGALEVTKFFRESSNIALLPEAPPAPSESVLRSVRCFGLLSVPFGRRCVGEKW